jgi:glycosyltransferase involved in cell wall biosynthesis
MMTRVKSAVARMYASACGRWRHLPYYVSDGFGWVIDAEGSCIAREIKAQFGVDCRILHDSQSLQSLYAQVVHFGCLHVFSGGGWSRVNGSNRIAVTVFHGDPADPAFSEPMGVLFREIPRVSRIVVSCRTMAERLVRWGVAPELLCRILVGVDRRTFRPPSEEERQAARGQLAIPPGQVVVGSFQKDGAGWGEGLEPKPIKGPDVFLQVLDMVRREAPVTVLLTGPARGYVRRGLERIGVPYRHVTPRTAAEMAACYHALDLYLITSREEGGPKAVAEAMATGVPLVSTRVGIAADLMEHGTGGFLCDVEDARGLAHSVLQLIGSDDLRARFRENGYRTVQSCDFRVVARQHYEQVYAPLLATFQ